MQKLDMEILPETYEKLGKFYLGKEYDIKASKLQDDLVLYDSKDLVTHGVVLGMTGSGKTGLCISLLEEAAVDNIPAIVIDPKGDISNLMLTFPEFKGEDFRPWINEDDALKKGRTADEHAAQTAQMWKEGIASWGQSSERVKKFKENVDINIFTPGSRAGVPVSILSSLEAPPFEILDDGELLGERIESTVSSLLSLVGIDADPIQSEEAVLLSAIFSNTWQKEQNITLESLIRHIQKPAFDKVGIIDVESYYPAKKRQSLAMKFNALLASPGFSTWLEGPGLDIQSMLYQEDGKAKVSIFSISHLSDSERMFFVSILLNQMLGWMRTKGGTTSLRALLYMDEIYGYLPPTANPPSKKPMMTMLKQGRAFGLGCLLATQNPVDLDYKALSNIGTWWLGRLQTERDKARVLDGLEGAAASQNGGFNRAEMEQLLAGLGSRVFLMNNVHEDTPVVFHVRWVMSYLRGPLTRRKIKELMDPKREKFLEKPSSLSTDEDNPMGMPSAKSQHSEDIIRPVLGEGIEERFIPVAGSTEGVYYEPYLLRHAVVHFSSKKCDIDSSRVVKSVCPIKPKGIDWENELVIQAIDKQWLVQPEEGVYYHELPGYAMNEKNYKVVTSEFIDLLYRKERLEILYSPLLKEYSQFGESERDFRVRMTQKIRELRDEEIEELREKVARKVETKEGQLQRAQATVSREKSESSGAKIQAGISVVGAVLGLFMGRKLTKTSLSKGGSAVSSTTRAFKQGQDVKIAQAKVEGLEREIADLAWDLKNDINELEKKYSTGAMKLEAEKIKPFKKDIVTEYVGLLWVPFDRYGKAVF